MTSRQAAIRTTCSPQENMFDGSENPCEVV